jgi:hypothetical protein
MSDPIRSPRVPLIQTINSLQATDPKLYEALSQLKGYVKDVHGFAEAVAQAAVPSLVVDRSGKQSTASTLGLVSWNNSDNLYSVQGPPDPNSDPTVPSPFQNYTGDILHATGGKAVGGRIATSV